MKASATLFRLIKSLEQSEKRYFKIYAKRHVIGKKNTYVKVFDWVDEMDEYDETSLHKRFQTANLKGSLPYAKHYLTQLILRAMRAYRAGKRVDTELHNLIVDLNFLNEKRLFSACAKLLRKAKKLADKHERFPEWLKLLEFERRFVKQSGLEPLEASTLRILAERTSVLHRMQNQYAYIGLYDEMFTRIRRELKANRPDGLELLKHLRDDSLFKEPKQAKSFHAKSYFFLCHAYLHQLKGEFEEANNYYRKNIDHWAAHPHWVIEDPYNYQRALSNYLGNCHMINDYAHFPEYLLLVKNVVAKTTEEKIEQFTNYYQNALLYAMSTFDFAAGVSLIPAIEAGLKKYNNRITTARKMSFCFNCMILHFYFDQSSASLRWLNRILNEFAGETRVDIQRLTRIFQLIIHFDLGNIDLLDSLMRSAQRYFSKLGGKNQAESHFLAFFQEVLKDNTPENIRVQLKRTDEILANLSQSKEGKYLAGLTELRTWIKAKLERKPPWEISPLQKVS